MRSLLERLEALVPGASRRTLRQILEHGRVLVDGREARRGDLLVPDGTPIRILPKEATRRRPPSPVAVVHADPHLVVVEKPPGMITADVERRGRESVWSSLRRALAERRPPAEPFIVHRLDEGASGLLVFALSEKVRKDLKAIFEKHDVERRYAAVVTGRLAEREGEFRSLLLETEGPPHRVRSIRSGDPAPARRRAREAISRYTLLGSKGDLSALDVRLETGRKHQIRVHLSEAGHPILGDSLYGGPPADRLYLHAWVLGFVHPVTGEAVRWVSPPPRVFRSRVPGAFQVPPAQTPR